MKSWSAQALHGSTLTTARSPFVRGGRCWSKRPGMQSGGFGVILIPFRFGSLGEINENKVVTETFYIYAAFLKEPSVGVKLFGKVSDSFSNFDGYSASKRLPTAQNFPMTIPVTRPTNSQTSNMNIKFIASPPYFYGERSAMSMPNHREGSKEKERSNGATTKRS